MGKKHCVKVIPETFGELDQTLLNNSGIIYKNTQNTIIIRNIRRRLKNRFEKMIKSKWH